LFDVIDYTQDFERDQSSGFCSSGASFGFDESRDADAPLAIDHIGPLRSVSLFSGVVERDSSSSLEKPSSDRPCLVVQKLVSIWTRVLSLFPIPSRYVDSIDIEGLASLGGRYQDVLEAVSIAWDRYKPDFSSIDTQCLQEAIQCVLACNKGSESNSPSSRGRVIGLSRRSRLRLQVRINRCKFQLGRVWFLTLTYPREFPPHCAAKNDLRAFLKRIARKWGKRGAIWRIENQKRGAPHFHLILFLAAAVPEREFVEWVSRSWHAVVGSGDENHLYYGARTELFRSARGVASYCSKYVSKQEEGERVRLIEGRQWGREGDFPEERIDFVFEEKAFFRFWRILRRSRGLVGHVGIGGGVPWKNLFCSALHDDWLRLASLLGGFTTGAIESQDFYL
jgi:hypothetical protein